MDKKTTLLFHDTFIHRSGTERVNINIANILEADIATAIWSANSYEAYELGYHGKVFELFRRFYSGWIGFIRMKWAFLFSRNITKNYKRIIFSNEALTALHRVMPWTETIYYAHSLPHELFDGHSEHMKSVPLFFHEFYVISHWLRKILYIYELRKVEKIITNSKMNQEWLIKWSRRSDIIVIYPPVNALRFHPVKIKTPFLIQEHNNVESVIEKEIKDYYISPSRLKKNKWVDKIIHAFMHMPDKYLIILYNPNDSEKQVLMNMARGCNNIFFHHESSDMGMAKIIANSVATLSLAKDENFSLVSIESMACGIPMISVDDGAVKESITQGKTGILLPKEFTVYNVIDAVIALSPEKSLSMQAGCLERTRDFSLERFSVELRSYMN
jgi:glycosyltransferase involved in cell wall biosynthesis